MGDVVNLRMARKRKVRADKEAVAAENRVIHGRTKEEKTRLAAERRIDETRLDGHRLSSSGQTGDDGETSS